MTSGNSLSTAGITKLAAMLIVGVVVIAAVLAPMLNDLTRETIVEDYNSSDDASWIRMNYGTENIDTEYSVAGDTLTIGDQSGAAQDMILYADEKSCVMYSDGFTIVNGYSDPATVTKAETVHITNADGTLTISDGTDIIIQTSSPAWAYYPDKEGTYSYFSADVDGVKVKDGNQAMAGKEFAGVYTYNGIVIGPDNIGDLGMSMDADIQDGVIQTVTWAKGVADADTDTDADDPLTTAQAFGESSMPNLGSADPSSGTRIGDLYYTFSGTDATVVGYASTINWSTFISIPDTVVDNGTTYTVTSIGYQAFTGCKNLALTSLPSGLTSIDNNAFQNCTSLALTSLPDGITRIGQVTFYGCTSLALTSLPSGLTSIGGNAFNGCTNLALTSLPNGLTSIGNDVFNGCTNLALTSLPNSITSIGSNAFQNCTSLALTSLPSGLTTIRNAAFQNCTNLALTSLPSGLTSLPSQVFQGCTNLALTDLPSGMTTLGSQAFYNCTSLALTSLPSGLTSIGSSAFSGCTNLALTSLPSGLTIIDRAVFQYCTSLALTSLPNGVTSIGESAFAGCTNLALTSLPDGVTQIGLSAFQNCTNLALTSLPSGLTSLNSYVFSGCTNLALTSLPSGLTGIPLQAFYNCTNLALTSLPSGITYIGDSAFYGCRNLALTSLPDGVTSIGNSAFSSCRSLALTSLPSGVTYIGMSVFYYCTSITSLIIQSSPTIGSNAFNNCTNLKQILNLGDLDIVAGSTDNGSIGRYADEVRSDIPAMGYVAPLSYTKVVVKEGTAYDILLMMPVLLVIALLIPIADYFVGDNIRSRVR